MVYIDAVHYEQDEYGNEYIARMKWTNYLTTQATDECTKRQMIDFINKNPNRTKTKYFVMVTGLLAKMFVLLTIVIFAPMPTI